MNKAAKEKVQNRKLIITSIMLTLLVGFAAILVVGVSHRDYASIPLNEHWQVASSDAEMQYKDISVSEIPFSDMDFRGSIFMSKVLPENTLVHPELSIRLQHCALKVYLEEECIASFFEEEYQRKEYLGSGYFYIPLPEDFAGKTLTLEILKGKDSFFHYMNQTCIMAARDNLYSRISENFLALIIAVFLVMLGIIEIVYTVLVVKLRRTPRFVLSMSAFSICVGVWMSCNNGNIQLLSNHLHLNMLIEYISLYFLPVALASLIRTYLAVKKHKKQVQVLEIMFLLAASISLVLHVMKICSMPTLLTYFQLGMLTAGVFVVIILVSERRMHVTLQERIAKYGMIVFLLFGFVEIVRYYINGRYNIEFLGMQSLLPVGALFWCVAILTSFIIGMYDSMLGHAEKEMLLQIAYTDVLTMVNNRAKCQMLMQEYEDENKPILIINIDLNYFKEVNDIYGHSEGDRLLCLFSTLLQDVYHGVGHVGRMGGDEFIVIMDAMEKEEVEQTIEVLIRKVEKKNAEHSHPYTLSFAYGYATNREDISILPWEVYKRADKEMYSYKKRVHDSREGSKTI